MIVMYIDYQGPKSIVTKRFIEFDKSYFETLAEIEKDSSIIDSVKIFRKVQCTLEVCTVTAQAAQETLVNTTNTHVAIRKARQLAAC